MVITIANNNRGKRWSPEETAILKRLIKGNTPTRVIAIKLKRTESGVESKTQNLGISLKPVNQSPYNRKKKNRK